MLDLKGKNALVTGIANKRSIAFGVAERLTQAGAKLAVAYQPMEKAGSLDKLRKLTDPLGPDLLVPLEVTDEGSVQQMYAELAQRWGKLDILVHSIASAKREELGGRTSDVSEEGFLYAMQVSAYSLIQLVRHARPLMREGGSVITMTYIGSQRTTPAYNVMGSAKAALEANVRYLAMELGAEGIRVNAVSAGPIRTLSASGIDDLLGLLKNAADKSALKRNITVQEVAHTTAFLASDMASGITGQVIYVDGGFNIHG